MNKKKEIIRTIRNFKRILKSGNGENEYWSLVLGYIYKNIHY